MSAHGSCMMQSRPKAMRHPGQAKLYKCVLLTSTKDLPAAYSRQVRRSIGGSFASHSSVRTSAPTRRPADARRLFCRSARALLRNSALLPCRSMATACSGVMLAILLHAGCMISWGVAASMHAIVQRTIRCLSGLLQHGSLLLLHCYHSGFQGLYLIRFQHGLSILVNMRSLLLPLPCSLALPALLRWLAAGGRAKLACVL